MSWWWWVASLHWMTEVPWNLVFCDSAIPQSSDFQPFSSHGTHKLITKILWHTKKYIFCWFDKKYFYFYTFQLLYSCWKFGFYLRWICSCCDTDVFLACLTFLWCYSFPPLWSELSLDYCDSLVFFWTTTDGSFWAFFFILALPGSVP